MHQSNVSEDSAHLTEEVPWWPPSGDFKWEFEFFFKVICFQEPTHGRTPIFVLTDTAVFNASHPPILFP